MLQKKLLSLLSVVTVVLIVSACNGTNDNSAGDESTDLQTKVDGLQQQVEELEVDLAEKEAQLEDRDDTISDLEAQLNEQEESAQNEEKGNDETIADEGRLQERANNVVIALENENYQNLSDYIHPDKGVQFSPYANVKPDEDLTFQVDEVAAFANDREEYEWGTQDGSGNEIIMTPAEYYDDYIYIRDFSSESEEVAINEIGDGKGNLIVNVEEEYPNADFVSYYVSAGDEELDWANLILAFEEYESDWYLVGLIVDRWTI